LIDSATRRRHHETPDYNLECGGRHSAAATLCASQSTNSNGAAKSEAKPNSHIKTKYNQSKNETTVTLKTLALSNSMNREFTRESEFGNLDLDVSFIYQGK